MTLRAADPLHRMIDAWHEADAIRADLIDPDPADEFDPTEEDEELARMAAFIGEEVSPY